MLERDRIIEIVVSICVVGLFAVVLYLVGAQYNTDGLSSDGGLVFIGAITGFVLVMAAAGIGLAYYMTSD